MSARVRLEIEREDYFTGFLLEEGGKKYEIGTDGEAALRIDAAAVPAPVHLRYESESRLLTSDGKVYFGRNSSEKLSAVRLAERDSVTVFYMSGRQAFLLSVLPDPEYSLPAVTEKLCLAGKNQLTVGSGEECGLKTAQADAAGADFTLIRKDGRWTLLCSGSKDRLRVNGRPVRNSVVTDPVYILAGSIPFYLVEDVLYYPGGPAAAAEGERVFREENGTYPVFRSGPRRLEKLETAEIRIPLPQKEQGESAAGLLRAVLPAVLLMGGLFLYSRLNGGNTFSWFGMFSVGAGLAATLIGFTAEKIRTDYSRKRNRNEYTACIRNKEEEIRRACADELERMNRMYHGSEENLECIRSFSPELFDRRPGAEDFLQISLGRGEVPAETQVMIPEGAESAGRIAEQLSIAELKEKYRMLRNAPVVLDGRKVRIAGICGSPDVQRRFFGIILLDLITRQHPDDVKCSFFLRENEIKELSFLQDLPETRDGKCRNIAWNRENAEKLAGKLYGELRKKEDSPFQVIFVTDRKLLFDHPICSMLKNGEDSRALFIFFAENTEQLPAYTEKVIEGETENAVLRTMSGEKSDFPFRPFRVSSAGLREAVRILAPVCSAEKQIGMIMEGRASLMQLPGMTNIRKNWEESLTGEGLRVPVGFDERQEPVYIDLHEKADGPHAILAGDSGSGKSELLLTYILSAAARFHPSVLNFFVIDFKGGGLSGRLKGLPHLNGCITDMDSYETGRAVKAIRAEIRRREKMFSIQGVSHIDEYRKVCPGRKDAPVLPHLVIIVDEFAEMKREYPQILEDLVSAARVGRSLGIHLILATQKPAGQISEQIGSNARLRLCLRVRSAEDSFDMLNTPIACEIREPGRGFLQTGSNERFEIFQTAYAGRPSEKPGERRKYSVWETEADGSRKLLGKAEKDRPVQQETEAEQLLEEVKRAGEELPPVCLQTMLPASLPELIGYGEREHYLTPDDPALSAHTIGIIDDPDLQCRKGLCTEQLPGNLLIAGDAGSGKTETLMLLIRVTEEGAWQEEGCLYLIDCGGGRLRKFEDLPSVGGVVLPGEDEKCARLFTLLENELTGRRNEARRKRKIFVLIDELRNFTSDFPEIQEKFRDLLRKGPSAGICFAAACETTVGIGSGILRSFDAKLIFGLRDSMERLELLGRNAPERKKIPGRALTGQNGKFMECQIFRAFPDDADSYGIVNWLGERKAVFRKESAEKIPVLPEKVLFSDILSAEKETLPLGISCTLVQPVLWNLKYDPVLVLSGGDGKHQHAYIAGLRDCLSADAETELLELDAEAGEGVDLKLKETLIQTEAAYRKNKESGRLSGRRIILISGEDAYEQLSKDRELIGIFSGMLGKAGRMKLNFIFADVPNEQIGFQSPELLRAVRDRMRVLFFEPVSSYRLAERYGRGRDGKFCSGKDAFFFGTEDTVRIRFCQ